MKRDRFNQFIYVAVVFCAFCILEKAEVGLGYSPFGVAFYFALLYARRNCLLASPVFVATTVIFSPTISSLIYSSSVVAVGILLTFVFKQLKKDLSLSVINTIAFICRLPQSVIWVSSGVSVYNAITALIVGQVFCYVSCICAYCTFVRGFKARFTLDELISMGIALVVFSAGLCGFKVVGVKPFFAFAIFFSLLTTYAIGANGIIVSVLLGVGAIFGGESFFLVCLVVGSVVTLAFRSVSPYVSAIIAILSICGVGQLIGENLFSSESVIALCVGALAFCLLPRGVMEEISSFLFAVSQRQGGRSVVNRNRLDLSRKLSSLATLFWEFSSLLSDGVSQDEEQKQILTLCEKVKSSLCDNCPKREECEQILDGKTTELLYPVCESAIRRGKGTLLELSSYFTGSCIKVGQLIPLVNLEKEKLINLAKEKSYMNAGKRLVSEQFFSVGELLGTLATDIRTPVGFDLKKERELLDELAYKNVVCSEVVIEWGIGKVLVFAKEGAEQIKVIEKVASKVLKKKMKASIDSIPDYKGFDVVVLEERTDLEMALGEANSTKEGEKLSGDSRLIFKPDKSRYVLAVADGMGSGEKAERVSAKAVSLIENFYKAGFTHERVVSLVNKTLTFTGEECYNTLDMCVCDMKSGSCDFIKLGACPSFLKRGERVEVLEGEALPMGVIQEITPTIINKEIQRGDMIILVSDGVTDSIGVEELTHFISSLKTPNPQEMANFIKKRATARGAIDDVSVAVGRIYSN